MARNGAFDRHIPDDDHNPLKNLLGWEAELGDAGKVFGDALGPLWGLGQRVLQTILGQTDNPLEELRDFLGSKWTSITDLQERVENIPVLGDFFEIITGNPDSDAGDAGSFIRGALDAIRNGATGGSAPAPGNSFITDLFNAITGVRNTATSAQSAASSAQTTAGNAQTAASNANTLANAAQSAASDALSGVTHVAQNIFNTWFGSDQAAGTPVEVQQTIAAIKQAVIGGYTVDTFTSNGTWNKPANLIEWWGICIGGGGKAMPGTTSATNSDVRLGGVEGSSGGYIAQQIAPSDVPASLPVTVGTGATTNGANGAITSIGSLVSSSPNGSGISMIAGFTPASSTPGKGGAGGQATGSAGSAGTAGGSTPLAAGGAGGAGKTGGSGTATAGGPGGTASLTGPTKAGGGGGGGGGGNGSTGSGTKTGGAGGNGGYPGGGSGGGGAAVGGGSIGSSQVAGQPGTAPNGVAFIIYKTG